MARTTRTATRPLGGWSRRGEVTLDSRRNGLNLLRLVFASLVLVAHGWYISGKGIGPQINGENLGGWAVFGFFAISGYLITGSRAKNGVGTYLVHRVARIFPAFLVCLVVTAFVFAPIAYVHQHHTIDGFLTTAVTPMNYVILNAGLKMQSYQVAATPAGVPYAGAWDGSLWSLYYEFICYLIIGALLTIGFVRRHARWLALACLASIAAYAALPRMNPYIGGNGDILFLTKLLPFFLAGGLLYMLRDRVPLTWPIALVSIIAAAPFALLVPRFGPQLAAPLLTYVVMWLGAVVPCPDLLRRHDVSYGVYIYAFPVQQLFAVAGLATVLALPVFDALALIAVVPLAAASWLLVERPLMQRARRATHRPVPVREQQAAPVEAVPAGAALTGTTVAGDAA